MDSIRNPNEIVKENDSAKSDTVKLSARKGETVERTINGGQYDVNVLSSVYEKSAQNLVTESIARENIGDIGVFYLKNKASALLADGVQFPKRLTDSLASNGIVHNFSEKVNMNIQDVTQSQQFKRWFGDWQNRPENAGKIVDADGTTKVMYHGSPAQFAIFDKKKARSSGTYDVDSIVRNIIGRESETDAFKVSQEPPRKIQKNACILRFGVLYLLSLKTR